MSNGNFLHKQHPDLQKAAVRFGARCFFHPYLLSLRERYTDSMPPLRLAHRWRRRPCIRWSTPNTTLHRPRTEPIRTSLSTSKTRRQHQRPLQLRPLPKNKTGLRVLHPRLHRSRQPPILHRKTQISPLAPLSIANHLPETRLHSRAPIRFHRAAHRRDGRRCPDRTPGTRCRCRG